MSLEFTLGDRLRKARIEAGLDAKELAGRLHVSTATVSRAENGRFEPKAVTVFQWAAETGVSLEWIAYGREAA